MPLVAAPAVVAALAAIVAALAYVFLRESFKAIAAAMPGLLGLVRDALNAIGDWIGARIESVVGPAVSLAGNIAATLDNARAAAEGVLHRVWSFAWSVPNVLIPRAIAGVTSWVAQEWQRAIDFSQAIRGEVHDRITAVQRSVADYTDARADAVIAWTRDLWTGLEARLEQTIGWTNARVDAAQRSIVDWVQTGVVPGITSWTLQHVAALSAAIAGTHAIATAAQATATATARCVPRCGSNMSDLLSDLEDDTLDGLGYLAAAVLGLMVIPHADEAIERLRSKGPVLAQAAGRLIRG